MNLPVGAFFFCGGGRRVARHTNILVYKNAAPRGTSPLAGAKGEAGFNSTALGEVVPAVGIAELFPGGLVVEEEKGVLRPQVPQDHGEAVQDQEKGEAIVLEIVGGVIGVPRPGVAASGTVEK